MLDPKVVIAKRIAKEMKDGYVVNLGIGIPTLIPSYIPSDMELNLQSENGIMGMDAEADETNRDFNIRNAGGRHCTIKPNASFFDSATSFALIRGGHVDVTVLGALQVDEKGNLASHIIPGKSVNGMGGAMDLVTGAKHVIVATTHTAKDGSPKIVERCTLPLTAAQKVNLIVTELAVIEVVPEGLLLKEIAEGTTLEEVHSKTGAKLIVDVDLKTF